MKIPISKYYKDHEWDVKKSAHIAFVVSGNTVISVGYNRKIMPKDGVFTVHAEAAALKKAGRRARGATLHSIRIKKDGSYGLAKPCPKCQVLIDRLGMKVKYSSELWNEQGSQL